MRVRSLFSLPSRLSQKNLRRRQLWESQRMWKLSHRPNVHFPAGILSRSHRDFAGERKERSNSQAAAQRLHNLERERRNVRNVRWDSSLAQSASAKASSCQSESSSPSQLGNKGEN